MTIAATAHGRAAAQPARAQRSAPPPIPQAVLDQRVAAAKRYAAGRQGSVSFALVDAASGAWGLAETRRFKSASVVKAMLLVGFLRKIDSEGRQPSPSERRLIHDMIHVSDNAAADEISRRVGGPSGLYRVARLAGMQNFSVYGTWGSWITASDQARFFVQLDRLLPRATRAFALAELSGISSSQSWGVPQAARPAGWRVHFKGGWRSTDSGQMANQSALLLRGPQRLGLAILTDGSPSHGYGVETVRGVAMRLFRANPPS